MSEKKAKSIMIQGTMSNAGKSLIAAGLCRIFRQDGYRVVPFKSQNMALNSFITRDNLEMGRAQVVQARACGVEPDVRMNPILLKPTTDMGSQVIVMGEVMGNMRAMDYFKKKKEYIPVIRQAYESLAVENDIVVIEGAGSPAEINLKKDDIVNMGMAAMADAPVLLVGDIDRGGVFAQLIGTVSLLEPEEQERICGLIINKFRGDKKILEPGLDMIYEKCGKKVLGVVPYAAVDIEEEDSLAESLNVREKNGKVDIAVLRLPKLSNFTDFQALSATEGVSVRYVTKPGELGNPDCICIPGTKNTVSDMKWLRSSGLEAAVKRQAEKGTFLVGICGGYQILGEEITDTCGAEGGESIKGMGLLPIITSFEEQKWRRQREGRVAELSGAFAALSGRRVKGYEIHMGKSVKRGMIKEGAEEPECFLKLRNEEQKGGRTGETGTREKEAKGKGLHENMETEGSQEDITDGFCKGNVFGTYLHGLFDEEEFRTAFLSVICEKKGISLEEGEHFSMEEYQEKQLDLLADILRGSLDMQEIYRIMGLEEEQKVGEGNSQKMEKTGIEEQRTEKLGIGESENQRTGTEKPETVEAENQPHVWDTMLPGEIEKRSFEIITEELGNVTLEPSQEPVIKRVIHTTADFDYLENLRFSPMAVEKMQEAIRQGACIVTDTQMARSGINKKKLAEFGGEVYCFMSDEDVAQAAGEHGTTRAVASMDKAAALGRDVIFAIGNAPTALIRLDELMREGKLCPKGIIGVPVGFVNVVQAKELILDAEVPHIVARGRKGGSNVAAAICNALLYTMGGK